MAKPNADQIEAIREALDVVTDSDEATLQERLTWLDTRPDTASRNARLVQAVNLWNQAAFDADDIEPLASNQGLSSSSVNTRQLIQNRIRRALGYPLQADAEIGDNDFGAFTIRFPSSTRGGQTEDGR